MSKKITGADLLNNLNNSSGNSSTNKEEKKKVTGADLLKGANSITRYQTTDTSGVNEDYINTFISDTNNFFKSSEEAYKGVGWGNASSVYDSTNKTWQDLKTRQDIINAWIYKNKNRLTEDGYKSLSDTMSQIESGATSLLEGFGGAKDFYSQFETEDSYNQWKANEDWKEELMNQEDFKEYSQKGADIENPTLNEAQKGKEVGNIVTFTRDNWEEEISGKNSNANWGYATNYLYTHLFDDEVAIYNYYLGKGDKKSADDYLGTLEETLNQRWGGQIAENFKETNLKWMLAVSAGLDQWASGVMNLDNLILGTEADSPSAIQYAASEVRESVDNKWLWDLGVTMSNQLPSILVGTVTGGAGGLATMGVSVAGNSYAEMRNLGYNEWQARGYSVLATASELALSKLLSGYTALGGGKLSGGMAEYFASKVDNAIAKTAIKFAVGKMGGEFVEEALQSVLEPAFKTFVTGGEEAFDVDLGEALYSGILGALSAGVLESVPTVVGGIIEASEIKELGNNFKTNGGDVDRVASFIKEHGETIFSADSVAYRLAGKVNENTSAYKIGLMLHDANATITEQNKADIIRSLTRKGIRNKDAKNYANTLAAVVAGYELTAEQQLALDANEYVSKTLTDVIINPNSTPNQRMAGFNEAIKMVKAENASKTAETTDAVDLSEGDKTVETGVDSEASEAKVTLNGEAVDIEGVSSIKDRNVFVRLNDGSEVNVKDLSFKDKDDALKFDMLVDMNEKTAADFIKSFNNGNIGNGKTISFEFFHRGFNEAYTYGKKGIPYAYMSRSGFAAELSEYQRRIAYQRGRIDKMAEVDVEQKSIDEKKATVSKTEKVEKKKGKVHYDEVNIEALPSDKKARVKTSIKALEVVSEALGVDIHLFESAVDEKGNHIGENGSYDPTTNTIRIDIHSGIEGEGLMLFTAAHELTHFIKEWSPKKFKVFADFLLEQYAQHGVPLNTLIEAQLEKGAKRWEGLSESEKYDRAYEEVIADACESMLTDSKALQKLAMLNAKDKGLVAKIRTFINELVAKIKKAYASLRPDSKEGKCVREMVDAATQLQKMWTEALLDAGDSYQAVGEKTATETKAEKLSDRDSSEVSETEWKRLKDEYRETSNLAAEAKKKRDSIGKFPRYDELMDLITDKNSSDEALNELLAAEKEWEKESGYAEAHKEYDSLYEKARELRRKADNMEEQLSKALREKKYSEEEVHAIVQKAVRKYHTTTRLNKASYLLTTGSMLDFSEGQGYRIKDHREISDILNLPDYAQYSDGMIVFMNMGNIRLQTYGIDISSMPNDRQISTLRGIISEVMREYDEFSVDFSKPNGNTDGSVTYPKGVSSARIISDIKNYFETGDIPEYNDTLSQFRYSDRGLSTIDSEYISAVESGDTETARRLVDEAAKEAGYTIKSYHGTLAKDFTEFKKDFIGSRFSFDDRGFFFIDRKSIAEDYASSEFGSKKGKVFEVYLKVKKPLLVDTKFVLREGLGDVFKNDDAIGVWDNYNAFLLEEADNIRADGIIINDRMSKMTVVFEPIQIKSADTITYDNEGKVILLSKRFKSYNRDIRYSDRGSTGYELIEKYAHLDLNQDISNMDGVPAIRLTDGSVLPFTETHVWFIKKNDIDVEDIESGGWITNGIYESTERSDTLRYKEQQLAKRRMEAKRKAKLSDRDSAGNTLTKEQQEFFKDSKVRDEQGNLLVVYHGSKANPTVFKKEFISSWNMLGKGYYFTSLEQKAKRFAKESLKECYLNIKNPFLSKNREHLDKLYQAINNSREDIESYSDEKGVGGSELFKICYYLDDIGVDVSKILKELGFDGIYYEGYEDVEIVAYESDQIKLTSNKTPTANPDIRYSERNFSYDELVAKGDLQGTVIKKNQQVKLTADGSIDVAWVVSEVKNKCETIKTKGGVPTYFTNVPDIGRKVEVTKDGIKHGFIKYQAKNGKVSNNSIVNARVALEIPKILATSIEVNRSKRGNNIDIPYSHIMLGTVALEDANGNLEYYVVRSVIEERVNQNPILAEAKILGRLYAVNAKKISLPTGRGVAKSKVALPSGETYLYNIADFIKDVNQIFDNTFSLDVHKRVNTKRSSDSFSQNLLYSDRDQNLAAQRAKVAEVLAKENAELREDNEYLKELVKLQRKVTHGTVFTKNSLTIVAGKLMTYAKAKGNKAELIKLLNDVYGYIAANEDITWEDVKEKAQPAIDWLKDNVVRSSKLDSRAVEILKDLRSRRIYLNEEQQSEAAYVYGSFYEFRKRAMGSLTVVKKDNPGGSIALESVWQELAEMYPDFFDSETTSAEMPARLMEIIDTLRTFYDESTAYAFADEMVDQDLLWQVYDGYWGVSTLHTAADSYQKKINELKFKHNKKMRELREYHNNKHTELKQEYKEKISKVRDEYRERNAKNTRELMDRFKEQRERAAEGRHKTEMRHKIQKVVGELNKILHNGTKERNVKIELQETVKKALDLAELLLSDEYTNAAIARIGVESVTESEEDLLKKYNVLLDVLEPYKAELDRLYEERRELNKLVYKLKNSPGNEAEIAEANAKIEDINKQIEEIRNNEEYINTSRRISSLNSSLSDLFIRERNRYGKANAESLMDALIKAYDSLKESETDYIRNSYQQELSDKLNSIRKKFGNVSIKDMSLADLESIYQAYAMVKHVITEANTLFRNGRKEDLGKRIESVQAALREMDRDRKDRTKVAEWVMERVRSFSWNNLRPVDAFERLGVEPFKELFWDAVKAQDTYARDVVEAGKIIAKAREDYGYKKWDLKTAKTFKTINDLNFKLTLGDMMSIYAYSFREQAYDHMTKGGFTFDKGKTYKEKKNGSTYVHKALSETYIVGDVTIQQIINELTPEQKAYVEAIQNYLTALGQKGNEVARVLYGIDIFTDKHYFPLQSSEDYRSSVEQELNKTQTMVSLKNTGMTKETKPHASNPIVLRAFDDVVLEHIDKMSKYHAYVIPIENLQKVFNNSAQGIEKAPIATKALMKSVFGDEAREYFNQYITDLNGGGTISGARNPLAGFFGKAKGVAVAANLSVVAQQYFAVIRAMTEVDPKYFVPYLNKEASKSDGSAYEELKKYAPVAVIKEMGGFDIGSNRGAKDYIGSVNAPVDREQVWKKFQDATMAGASLMDKLGWVTIWKAVKKEIASTRKDLAIGSEAFLNACGERFTEVVTKTQVYDSVNTRSGYMRSKHDSVKYITSFMGEPTVSIGMYFTAINNFIRALRSNDKAQVSTALKKVARVSATLPVAGALTAMAKAIIQAMRDDDEDESYGEKWIEHYVSNFKEDLNPMNYLPVFRDIVSLIEGWDVDRPDMTLIADLITSVKKMGDEDATAEDVLNAFTALTNIFGIPLKNVVRDVKGFINTIISFADGEKTTGAGIKEAIKEGWTGKATSDGQLLYEAIISGNQAQINRIKGRFKDQKAITSAITKALQENDSRIGEAAKARYNGDIASYTRIAREIISEGNFDQDAVIRAINAAINSIKRKETVGTTEESSAVADEATSIYSASDINAAFDSGDTATAKEIIQDLINTKVANGKTQTEAKSSIRSSLTSYWKPLYKAAYKSNNTSEMYRIRLILLNSGLYGGTNDVVKTVQSWLKD